MLLLEAEQSLGRGVSDPGLALLLRRRKLGRSLGGAPVTRPAAPASDLPLETTTTATSDAL
jgi:hypothetical protein